MWQQKTFHIIQFRRNIWPENNYEFNNPLKCIYNWVIADSTLLKVCHVWVGVFIWNFYRFTLCSLFGIYRDVEVPYNNSQAQKYKSMDIKLKLSPYYSLSFHLCSPGRNSSSSSLSFEIGPFYPRDSRTRCSLSFEWMSLWKALGLSLIGDHIWSVLLWHFIQRATLQNLTQQPLLAILLCFLSSGSAPQRAGATIKWWLQKCLHVCTGTWSSQFNRQWQERALLRKPMVQVSPPHLMLHSQLCGSLSPVNLLPSHLHLGGAPSPVCSCQVCFCHPDACLRPTASNCAAITNLSLRGMRMLLFQKATANLQGFHSSLAFAWDMLYIVSLVWWLIFIVDLTVLSDT
jgi:hypothetical protein